MQEEEDLGRVGVAFREREEVEVVVPDVEVLYKLLLELNRVWGGEDG